MKVCLSRTLAIIVIQESDSGLGTAEALACSNSGHQLNSLDTVAIGKSMMDIKFCVPERP